MENIPTVYYVYKSVFYVFLDMGGKDQRDKSAKESKREKQQNNGNDQKGSRKLLG